MTVADSQSTGFIYAKCRMKKKWLKNISYIEIVHDTKRRWKVLGAVDENFQHRQTHGLWQLDAADGQVAVPQLADAETRESELIRSH